MWEQSQERKQVEFRVVKANRYQDVSGDRDWPADIRWIRDALQVKVGTPRFIVAADGKIHIHKFGTNAWASDVYPLIQQLVSQRPANQ